MRPPLTWRRAVGLSAVALLVSSALAAQQHPNLERGFSPDGAFAIGDIDNVNLFNGNLVLTIPIGPVFRVGGKLSYGLTLVYNGNVWDVEESCDAVACYTERLPNRASNAGLGWLLSLGRLVAPNDPTNQTNLPQKWVYESPDGAHHIFHPILHPGVAETPGFLYTRDGTYLRFRQAERRIEFPDGTVHTFDGAGRLIERRDPFGNTLTVSYATPGRWDLRDSTGRVHYVHFRPGVVYANVVDRVDLAAFAGRAVYTFSYAAPTISRGCPDNSPYTPPTETVSMLTGVTLPDGSSYAMPIADYHTGDGMTCEPLSGQIRAVTLPTLGRIEWDHQAYHFPGETGRRELGIDISIGVARRRLVDPFRAAGAPVPEWTYLTDLIEPPLPPPPQPPPPARELVNTVIDPLGHRTEHFFSVSPRDELSGWLASEYGLPLTRSVGDGTAPGRWLSSRTSNAAGTLLRSTYVRYESDQVAPAQLSVPGATDLNRREASTRTVYHDDANRVADVDRHTFDGLGSYRWTSTGGSFASGNVRHTGVNVNPGNGTYTVDPATSTFKLPQPNEPWMLEGVAWNQVTEGTATELTGFCFDASTGFVHRTRVLKASGISEHPNDVLVVSTPDAQGNVQREDFYGGDVQPLPANGTTCVMALPAAQYSTTHTYQSGSLASSQSAGVSFKSLDRTIDASSGLPVSSRDTAGLATSYEYDVLGRLLWEKPQQDAWTEYVYQRALSSTVPASVTIRQRANGSTTGAVLAESRIVFDVFGRVARDEQLLPGGVRNARVTSYNGRGWKESVSELQTGTPTKKTTFSGYDPFGRPGKIVPPDGAAHEVTISYAGVRTVTRVTKVGTGRDAAGNVVETSSSTTEHYDRQGRLVKVVEPSGAGGASVTTDYSYDVGNRLSKVQTAAAEGTQTRFFTYDQRGFLTAETHPEKGPAGNGSVHYFDYDAKGHARRRRDGGPGSPFDLTFTFDAAERLTHVRETNSPSRTLKAFTYATANSGANLRQGKLETAERSNYVLLGGSPFTVQVRETYTYAGKGGRVSSRLTQNLINGNQSDAFTQSWSSTDLGDVATTGYPQCTTCPAPAPRSVTSTYTNGFLTGVTGYASTISYHPNGMVNEVTHANGVIDTQANDPNTMRRPASITSTHNGVTRWTSGAYQYDGSGNVVKTGTSWYLYDKVSRLVTGTVFVDPAGGGIQKQQSYTFDSFGNIQSIGGTGARATPTSPATNRLSGAGTAYDAAGNLTAWNGQSYGYDALGTQVRTTTGTEEWLHLYTADDERLWSFQSVGGSTNRWTLRDLDGQVLREYQVNRSTGTWTVENDLIYRDGQLLAAETSQGRRHFHLDHLGTPRLITNPSGQQVAYHVYYPFGEEATAFNQDTQRMKLTGHERDLNSPAGAGDDLDYMHARFCSPLTARFLSVDPVDSAQPGSPQSWNRYAYARGNPMRFIDPDGEDVWDVVEGFANGFSSSMLFNVNRLEPRNEDYRVGQAAGDAAAVAAGFIEATRGLGVAAIGVLLTPEGVTTPAGVAAIAVGTGMMVHGASAVGHGATNLMESAGEGGGGETAEPGTDVPGEGKGWSRLRGGQGWRDPQGNIWKKDRLHKDHWDITDRKGRKLREVDFEGREIWPRGPKNKQR